MVKISELREGIDILSKYHKDDWFGAEHDILYLFSYEPEKLTKEELERLDELGFFESEDSWAVYS